MNMFLKLIISLCLCNPLVESLSLMRARAKKLDKIIEAEGGVNDKREDWR